jgi:hypothetical protein
VKDDAMIDPVDDELRVTAALATRRRDELVAEGYPGLAAYMNELAIAAADLRADRQKMVLEVDEAANPFQVVGEVTCEVEPSDPARDERLTVAVAEWQQGRARPARTALRCPAGHATSLGLFETSAGLLLVARAIDPNPGTPPHIPYATLLDHDGGYEGQCARCERRFHLDLGAVRQAVLASDTMYRAT